MSASRARMRGHVFRPRQQTDCGHPDSDATSLVAYLDGEPVGWFAVDRRSEYIRLGQTPYLAEAAIDFARERGARALEGYPMIPDSGQMITWGEIHVGHRKIFAAAGFEEVNHPSKRRCVMRIDF